MSESSYPFPDRENSMCLLQADPCYGKIPVSQVERVFEEAWQTGVREAERFMKSYCTGNVFAMTEILKDMGFTLDIQDMDYVMGRYRYFCEYYPEKKMVSIYQKSIALWAEKNNMDYDTAQDIILAHEYFHYLETSQIGLVSRHCLVPMLQIGKLSLGKTGVAALSEVGANAFANTYYVASCRGEV